MIYLCIRQTVDWADEAAFRAQLPPEFASTVRLWDETFDVPYHRFRQRVREIALGNAADLEGVRVVRLEQKGRGRALHRPDSAGRLMNRVRVTRSESPGPRAALPPVLARVWRIRVARVCPSPLARAARTLRGRGPVSTST